MASIANYESLNRDQLRRVARDLKIEKVSTLGKADLIKAIGDKLQEMIDDKPIPSPRPPSPDSVSANLTGLFVERRIRGKKVMRRLPTGQTREIVTPAGTPPRLGLFSHRKQTGRRYGPPPKSVWNTVDEF